MQSLAYIPASNGAANASLMTVTNVRAANAGTIIVNTVANAPAKFYASMGTPHTFTDPVTGETITVISETTAVDFAGSISGGNVNIDAIALGYTDTGSKVGDIIVIRPVTEWANNIFNTLSQSLNDNGSLKASAYTYDPITTDCIQSGGIWAALTGFNASMTAMTLWQGGYQGTVAAIASRTFTASKDTYVDVLRTLTGYVNTFTIVYTEVANGAASPALAANSVRLARIITNATTIATVDQYLVDSNGIFIYPGTPGSSRSFQLGSNTPWRLIEQGNTRKYFVNKTTVVGNLASNSTMGLNAISTPFLGISANAYHVNASYRGGFADQTTVTTYSSDLSNGNSLGSFVKNIYGSATLNFGNIQMFYEITFINGVTAF